MARASVVAGAEIDRQTVRVKAMEGRSGSGDHLTVEGLGRPSGERTSGGGDGHDRRDATTLTRTIDAGTDVHEVIVGGRGCFVALV